MPDSKLGYSQAASYTQAIADLFYGVMTSKTPADRELRNYFRQNKQCGSKDRKFISEGLYSLFRWFGWLREIIPIEKPDKPIEDVSFCKALSISLDIEDMTSPRAFSVIAQQGGYVPSSMPDSLKELGIIVSKIIESDVKIVDLVPEWFTEQEGVQSNDFYEALQKRPPVWIRVQNNGMSDVIEELQKNNLDFKIHENVNGAVAVLGKANLTVFKTYRAGKFEIQDLASQCLAQACSPQKAEKWWDVCAGAGGKTLALADTIGAEGLVFASDKRKGILEEVKKRSARGKFRNTKLLNLEREKSSTRTFDGVLVDAPCSCTGTWRRNPDARWTDDPKVCMKWSKVQLQILNEVSHKVKVGGVLVYATCSSSRIENEQVVKSFLEENPHYELQPFIDPLTGEKNDGMMTVNSLPDDCDVMFAAPLIRKKK